jgi:hypothetical protein
MLAGCRMEECEVWTDLELNQPHSSTIKQIIRVTGHGGPYGYETSRLSSFLDNRLIDDGEVSSLKRRPSLTPRKKHFTPRRHAKHARKDIL